MFDPTAFDNMKVVLEGAVYDHDLQGEILVTDRKDLIDLARFSRKYIICFRNKSGNGFCQAMLTVESGIENFAAEISRSVQDSQLAGVEIKVVFLMEHQDEQRIYFQLQNLLEKIWGGERTVKQEAAFSPLSDRRTVKNVIAVSFNRLLLEDQIESLPELVDYTIQSLREIEELFN